MVSRLPIKAPAYYVEVTNKDDIKWLVRLLEKSAKPAIIYMDGILYKFPTLEMMDTFNSALEFYSSLELK